MHCATSLTPRSFLFLVFSIPFTWAIKHLGYSGPQTQHDTLGLPENFLPANDATAKNLDNQLIALAKNDPESEHGSEEQAWVE